jgi:cation transport ATPase
MTAKHRNHSWKMLVVKVDGMHCANCEVLIERRFKKIAGVRRVNVSHITGRAEINCYGDLDPAALQRTIADDGYTVSDLREQNTRPSRSTTTKNTARDRDEIFAAFFILGVLYVVLAQFDLLPQNIAVPNEIGYGLALLIGLVASVYSDSLKSR